jgi:hypothetical protein
MLVFEKGIFPIKYFSFHLLKSSVTTCYDWWDAILWNEPVYSEIFIASIWLFCASMLLLHNKKWDGLKNNCSSIVGITWRLSFIAVISFKLCISDFFCSSIQGQSWPIFQVGNEVLWERVNSIACHLSCSLPKRDKYSWSMTYEISRYVLDKFLNQKDDDRYEKDCIEYQHRALYCFATILLASSHLYINITLASEKSENTKLRNGKAV